MLTLHPSIKSVIPEAMHYIQVWWYKPHLYSGICATCDIILKNSLVKLQMMYFEGQMLSDTPRERVCLPFLPLWQYLRYDPWVTPSFQRENRKEKQLLLWQLIRVYLWSSTACGFAVGSSCLGASECMWVFWLKMQSYKCENRAERQGEEA